MCVSILRPGCTACVEAKRRRLCWPPNRARVSRRRVLARLPGMTHNTASTWRLLAAAVAAHLAVSIVHGTAHTGAHVEQSAPALAFVFIVILAGPAAGLLLTWPAPRAGHWVIAATLAGSLLFGVVNHFVLDSPDHVAHVLPEWRTLFGWTAALLAITEALGAALAIRGALLTTRPA